MGSDEQMIPADDSLELSGAQFRELVEAALAHLSAHLDSFGEQPVHYSDDASEAARRVDGRWPESSRPVEELLQELFGPYLEKTFNTASPGYLAFIPGGGIPAAAAADLIAGAINRYVGVWAAAPALAQLETHVVRWFCELVGYPSEARGFLTTGGSLANWSAIVTARRCRLPENFLDGVLYTSDQAHHSVQKAAVLAGFPLQNVRVIPSDAEFRVRLDELSRQIEADRRAGKVPFCIVGHAGTTNTGAVDDLSGLADLAAGEQLWLHVDAAYGGFFLLTERGRRILAGLERADSITLDPHKGLFLPYGTGSLIVRRGEDLKRAHSLDADYLPSMQSDPEFVDFCQISPELSRDFRGLRLWLPLKMHGLAPFRHNLDEKLDLAAWAAGELERIDGIELVAPPQLSVAAFRLSQPGWDAETADRLNRELLARINRSRRIFLTATKLRGMFTIRLCVLCFRTHQDRVRECLEAVRREAAEVLKSAVV